MSDDILQFKPKPILYGQRNINILSYSIYKIYSICTNDSVLSCTKHEIYL